MHIDVAAIIITCTFLSLLSLIILYNFPQWTGKSLLCRDKWKVAYLLPNSPFFLPSWQKWQPLKWKHHNCIKQCADLIYVHISLHNWISAAHSFNCRLTPSSYQPSASGNGCNSVHVASYWIPAYPISLCWQQHILRSSNTSLSNYQKWLIISG